LKKEPKNFWCSGAWALAAPQPMPQSKGSLFGSFSAEKDLLSLPTITTVAKLQRIATASAHHRRMRLL
jgi:hypothetical protein